MLDPDGSAGWPHAYQNERSQIPGALSLNGKTVVVQGTATRKETSVEMLRHYAEDAGKSKTEIEAIKEPKVEITMQATGILVM